MKTVYFKNRFRGHPYHSLYRQTFENPPDGFQILMDDVRSVQGTRLVNLDRRLQSSKLSQTIWQDSKSLFYILWQIYNRKVENFGVDLVFSMQQLIFGQIPWIVDLEFADALVGYGSIKTCSRLVQKAINSRNCRKILPWSDWGKRTLSNSLNCKDIEGKIDTLRLAVKPKTFVRKKEDGAHIRILFVGSNNPSNIRNFELKGGMETLESFDRLTKIYDSVDLVIRSWVPKEILQKYSRARNITFYSDPLNEKQLQELYISSDIFLFPSHANLGMATLDAMAYELPVVAINVYDAAEAIDDMKTGILLEPPKSIPYYKWNESPNHYDANFFAAIRKSRRNFIPQIVKAVSVLVENGRFRRKAGREARKQIEQGPYSVEHRKKRLGTIFEEALRK